MAWLPTWAQLDQRVHVVAAYLGTVATPGSRVWLAFPTSPAFAGALFGCLLAERVAVPVQVPAGQGPGTSNGRWEGAQGFVQVRSRELSAR